MPNIKSQFSNWLFWDVSDISIEHNRDFIIIRVLNDGTDKDLLRLRELFSEAEIIHAVRHKRGLSRRTALFWASYYKIPYSQCKSLNM
ncbi:MAG: DUF6922 domain-containing protein [Candidatus Cloacimonadia bacterium]